jgi:hypothetical protein
MLFGTCVRMVTVLTMLTMILLPLTKLPDGEAKETRAKRERPKLSDYARMARICIRWRPGGIGSSDVPVIMGKT